MRKVQSSGVSRVKRAYKRPELQTIGDVTELTQQMGSAPGNKRNASHDGNGFAPMPF